MAKKNQEIKIVVHTPSNLSAVFRTENIEDFWIEKMSAKINECGLTKQELQCLLENKGTENV